MGRINKTKIRARDQKRTERIKENALKKQSEYRQKLKDLELQRIDERLLKNKPHKKKKSPNRKKRITLKYLDSLKTEKGGWGKEVLSSLGVSWPPKKGWKKRLIGKPIKNIKVPSNIREDRRDQHKVKYHAYLKSNQWKSIRNSIIEDRKRCERCYSIEELQVHHKTYENVFNEKDEDLELLCKSCHRKEHNL